MHERSKINIEITGNIDLIISSAFDLYEIPRTGWINRGIDPEKVENVGQHTEALTKLYLSLVDKIDQKNKLDRTKMMRMIQIHDWPESLAGDQVALCDDKNREKNLKIKKQREEIEAMKNICARFGESGKQLLDLWLEFETGNSVEAKLIRQLDKLQAVEKALKYQIQGEAVSAQEFIDNVKKRNLITEPILVELLEEIEKKCRK